MSLLHPRAPPLRPRSPRSPRSALPLTRFKVASQPTAIIVGGAAKARPPSKSNRGSAFLYTLSAPATATIVIERAVPGALKGKLCVAGAHPSAHAKRCTAYLAAGTLTRQSPTGSNTVPFSGRIGAKGAQAGVLPRRDQRQHRRGPRLQLPLGDVHDPGRLNEQVSALRAGQRPSCRLARAHMDSCFRADRTRRGRDPTHYRNGRLATVRAPTDRNRLAPDDEHSPVLRRTGRSLSPGEGGVSRARDETIASRGGCRVMSGGLAG